MVRRRNEYPEDGELVIGTVKAINPNSAFITLDEYGRDGMIHVSEVARRWVRDIRNFLKKGETVVCLVMDTDPDKGHITLSLKRVSDSKRNKRLQEWKRDQKGEKLLEKLAEQEGTNLNRIYEEVGFDIQDNFRDMLEAFETVQKNPELLERKGFSEKWIKALGEVADENLEIREEEIQGVLEARLFTSDAIDTFKEIFAEAEKEHDVELSYISAPKYAITYTTADLKKGDKKIRAAAEDIIEAIESHGGKASFRMSKE